MVARFDAIKLFIFVLIQFLPYNFHVLLCM